METETLKEFDIQVEGTTITGNCFFDGDEKYFREQEWDTVSCCVDVKYVHLLNEILNRGASVSSLSVQDDQGRLYMSCQRTEHGGYNIVVNPPVDSTVVTFLNCFLSEESWKAKRCN